MQVDIKKDMAWSASLFNNLVWPIIKPELSGGRLLQMEGRPDVELARQLDMLAGIDGWHVHPNGMRGIASRIQITSKLWNTFTVRMKRDSGAETEYIKRKRAISHPDRGWIYPAITVQAYAKSSSGPILSCGISLTSLIIKFIDDGYSEPRKAPNAEFAACSWDKMNEHGYPVKILMF